METKKAYEMRNQYRFNGILLPGVVPTDLYEKALFARFHNKDILLTSYPKSGMFFNYYVLSYYPNEKGFPILV